jgi:uncharacterized protein
MKLSEDYAAGSNIIHAYSHQAIDINGRAYHRSLVVSNRTLITDWPVASILELDEHHLQVLLATQPEVIIIGTGMKQAFPKPEIWARLLRHGTGIEFMDSGAACRTYNILLSEDRRVTAGIILET